MEFKTTAVANQRRIDIYKSRCDNKNEENFYFKMNSKAFEQAMSILKANEFRLYMYLISKCGYNKDNSNWIFSSEIYCNLVGISNPTYNTAFLGLIEKGYIVKQEGYECKFTFRDYVEI